MRWMCRCRRRPITCFVDEHLHRFHITVRWICDRHDRNIMGKPEDWVEIQRVEG